MFVWILIMVVGIIAVVVGLGIVASVRSRRSSVQPPPPSGENQVAQRVAHSGRVELEKLKCQDCGAELGSSDITAKEGIIFVSCSYCGSTYQLVEELK